MTELGVYILGATALALLGAAGIAVGNHTVLACAVIAAGSGYVAQLGAVLYDQTRHRGVWLINAVAMPAACLAWLFGVFNLI